MGKLFMAFVVGVVGLSAVHADQFDDLSKKQKQMAAADPFANRASRCVTRLESGTELAERWTFYGATKGYVQAMDVGITKRGKYEFVSGILKLMEEGPEAKAREFKIKIEQFGYKYIWSHATKDGKHLDTLYNCRWVK